MGTHCCQGHGSSNTLNHIVHCGPKIILRGFYMAVCGWGKASKTPKTPLLLVPMPSCSPSVSLSHCSDVASCPQTIQVTEATGGQPVVMKSPHGPTPWRNPPIQQQELCFLENVATMPQHPAKCQGGWVMRNVFAVNRKRLLNGFWKQGARVTKTSSMGYLGRQVINTTQNITVTHQPSISDISEEKNLPRAQRILKDNIYHSHNLFILLPSGKIYKSICCHTNRAAFFLWLWDSSIHPKQV